MTDLDSIKDLQAHRAQLQDKYQSLKADLLKAMSYGSNSDESRSIMAEFDALSKEIQAVNEQIFNIEHADEIKAEQERKARELADREKRLQEAKLAEEKRKAELLSAEQAKAQSELKAKEVAKAKIAAQESKLHSNHSSSKQFNANANANANANNIIDILKIQLTPSTICVEPNDVFIKTVFNVCKSAYSHLLGGKFYNVQEKRKTHKKDAVFSKLAIRNVEGYDNDTPLDEYDRAVLGIIISEYDIGNHYTTINIIHRALIGKVGVQNAVLRKNQKTAIINSVIKLMSTVIDFSGVNDSLKEMKYTDKDGNQLYFRVSNLLSADIIDAKINGQVMEGVIFFKHNSPLFLIADAKDQVIRYPHELLNVPKQNNTPLVISLKKYVMRRICEIKLHKQLAHIITFDDVFKKCKLTGTDKHKQLDARNAIIKFLEHLKAKKFITDFQVQKHVNSIHSVGFSF